MASRKDYRATAEVIYEVVQAGGGETAAAIARGLADNFKRDNSNFRYDLFFEACDLDGFGNPRA